MELSLQSQGLDFQLLKIYKSQLSDFIYAVAPLSL
jgi:hypothetical protein